MAGPSGRVDEAVRRSTGCALQAMPGEAAAQARHIVDDD
jgi:hypothetical protein